MNIAVLGATGFIGSHVAEQFALAGFKVRCLVRASSSTDFLQQIDVATEVVDFTNDEQLLNVFKTVDVVCNCIADTRQHIPLAEHRKTEVELTSRLFRLAEQASVKRFMQLSTVMVYGFKREALPIDESHPLLGQFNYNQMAIEREQALLSLAEPSAMQLLLIRPANAIGKRDTSFMPNFSQAANFGLFPVVNGGVSGFSCVDCRDIGRAFVHLLELEQTQTEIYLVKSFDCCWLDVKAALQLQLNKKLKTFSMAKKPFMFLARLIELLTPWGKEPLLTRFSLEVLSCDTLFDDSKIRATGFTPKYGLKEALADYYAAGS
jgi:nucleoside-diphosphate-sugar epimerase